MKKLEARHNSTFFFHPQYINVIIIQMLCTCTRIDKSKVCHNFANPQQVESRLPRSEKLRAMVRAGIPHSLRAQLWMRVSGALEKKQQSDTTYKDIVKASANDLLMTSKQIEKVRRLL